MKSDVNVTDVESKAPVVVNALSAGEQVVTLINDYSLTLYNVSQTAKMIIPHAAKWLISELESSVGRLRSCFPKGSESLDSSGENEEKDVELIFDSVHDYSEYNSAVNDFQRLHKNDAPNVLIKSLFIHLFSEFDAFTGRLLKLMYVNNSNLLHGISREISFSELICFTDISAVKLAILDKEVETFRRDSYVEQFSSLEKKFGLPLRKFDGWATFVELSQRRNLFTHNGGVVNEQYLMVCEREGYKFAEKPLVGTQLKIDLKYFLDAARLVERVGVMMALTLWRKLLSPDAGFFHTSVNNFIYENLCLRRWRFISEFSDFSLADSIMKEISDVDKRIRYINIAIALKFNEDLAGCEKVLKAIDWSASYRDFQLALAVLRDDEALVYELMRSIGKSGEQVSQSAYHDWPLFYKIKLNPEFHGVYFDIYQESFLKTQKGDGISSITGNVSESASASDIDPLSVGLAECLSAEGVETASSAIEGTPDVSPSSANADVTELHSGA